MSAAFDGVGGSTGAPAPAASASGLSDAPTAEYPATHRAYPPPTASSGGGRARQAWRDWWRTRPFWGGLLIVLGGVEISLTVKAPMRVVLHVGLQGIAGYALPLVMVLCGLLLWFSPGQRLFYSLVAVLVSLATWITSNLGGFFIGMLLGIIGGSLAFGWAPVRPNAPAPPDRAAEPEAG